MPFGAGGSDILGTLTPLLGGMAAMELGLAFAVRQVFRAPYPSMCIIGWALCASAATSGFLLRALGGSVQTMLGFIVAAGCAILLLGPSEVATKGQTL